MLAWPEVTCVPKLVDLGLQALSLMEVSSAQPLEVSELALHSSKNSGAAPQRKRKRSDEEGGALNGNSGMHPARKMSSSAGEAAAEDVTEAASTDAKPDQAPPDEATWDIEQPAGLQEVVRWCTDRQAFPLLQSQLQASPSSSCGSLLSMYPSHTLHMLLLGLCKHHSQAQHPVL